MSSTPFKTPHSSYFARNPVSESDSEGSTASEAQSDASNDDLSIVAMFDDLMRSMQQQRDEKVEAAFEQFAEESKRLFQRYCEVVGECERLQTMLNLKGQECSENERRLNIARNLLDKEKKKTLQVVRENEKLIDQLDQVRELLFKDNKVKIGEDAKQKLSFLDQRVAGDYNAKNLSCIPEVNSTGSMLSDFSVSKSEDGLDSSLYMKKEWKKHRPSTGGEEASPPKKRRSSDRFVEIGSVDTVRTTTTVTVHKKGPITATSVIEAVPTINNTKENQVESDLAPSSDDGIGSTAPSAPPSHLVFESWAKSMSSHKRSRETSLRPDQRQHVLQQKTLVMPVSCVCCEKRLRFGKMVLKCKECRSVCHIECKDQLPLPCIPVVNTPTHKNIVGIISDYTPKTSPMVPALIIHCVNEIELRGLNELGLYRLSASEKEVKCLKERFLKGRGSPSLVEVDIHVLCGCVKEFLRALNEPLIPNALWKDFTCAVNAKDRQDVVPALYQCLGNLPHPNRDTLAYMMLHLQKVASSPECKMPIDNLAKVFGPTLVGYSSDNPSPDNLLNETKLAIAVCKELLNFPSEYWASFVNISTPRIESRAQKTSSSDLPLYHNSRVFTPMSARLNKKRKIFNTPPLML